HVEAVGADLNLWLTRVPRRCRYRRMLGRDLSVRSRTRSHSTKVPGPWWITAAGLPERNIARKNSTAPASVRSRSGLATPPARTTPSRSSDAQLLCRAIDGK